MAKLEILFYCYLLLNHGSGERKSLQLIYVFGFKLDIDVNDVLYNFSPRLHSMQTIANINAKEKSSPYKVVGRYMNDKYVKQQKSMGNLK
jgi:hypothetical protein